MEDAIRKELSELCLNILKDIHKEEVHQHLHSLQKLEERLILLKYLQFRESVRGEETRAQTSEISHKLDEEIEQTLQRASQQSQPEETREKPSPQPPGVDKTRSQNEPSVKSLQEEESKEEEKASPFADKEPSPSEGPVESEKLKADETPEEAPQAPQREHESAQPKSPKMVAGPITLGLNDRISFTNHLFEGNQEDLNRVISQLNTFQSYTEAENFITHMVKPDYNWENKSEYEERLIDLVKARFGA